MGELDDPFGRRPIFTTLANVEPEMISWLWAGWIPLGKLAVLDGDPGVGKSTLTLDIAARVTTDRTMPDGTASDIGAAADVVLVSAEDGIADTLRPRADAAGADVNRIHMLTDVAGHDQDRPFDVQPWSMPRDLDVLQQLVARSGARLVVIDPLNAVLGSAVDSYRDQDVRGALKPLSRMAEETGAAVVVVRHLTKGGGGNALYRGGGSIGIIGAARAGLLVAKDPDDESGASRVLVSTKSNVAQMPTAMSYELVSAEEHGCASVAWLGNSAHSAAALLSEPSDEGDRSEQAEIADQLSEWIAEEGQLAVEEARFRLKRAGYGASARTIQRAARRAGLATSKPNGVGRKRYYYRPDSVDTPSGPPGGCPHIQTGTTRENAPQGPSVDSRPEVSTLDAAPSPVAVAGSVVDEVPALTDKEMALWKGDEPEPQPWDSDDSETPAYEDLNQDDEFALAVNGTATQGERHWNKQL